MLIRRRVSLIQQLVDELGLHVTVTLVRSAENPADALTRVPKDWLRDGMTSDDAIGAEEVGILSETAAAAACGAADSDSAANQTLSASIRAVHENAGHPGIRRTLFFARRDVSRDVT